MSDRLSRGLHVARVCSWIILLLVTSYFLIRNAKTWGSLQPGDRSTVLFGVASIALFFVATFVGVLAFVGFGTVKGIIQENVDAEIRKHFERLEKETQQRVINLEALVQQRLFNFESLIKDLIANSDKQVQEKMARLESEIRGRVLSNLGYMFGEASIKPGTQTITDEDRLALGVSYCQEGYEFVEKLEGPIVFMSLNNLVFYSCLSGDAEKREFLLTNARTLRQTGKKHNSPVLLLTYCCVMLRYGTPEEKKDACEIANKLAKAPYVTDRQRVEANFYLASFCQQTTTRVVATPDPSQSQLD